VKWGLFTILRQVKDIIAKIANKTAATTAWVCTLPPDATTIMFLFNANAAAIQLRWILKGKETGAASSLNY
jgi:hypothetical protein